MYLTDEDEMVAKKKFNEGKIDLEELNKLLGKESDYDEDEEIKDI
jgi:hypothetical protein